MKVVLCFVFLCALSSTMAALPKTFQQLAALVLQIQSQQKLLAATIMSTPTPNTLPAATQKSIVGTNPATITQFRPNPVQTTLASILNPVTNAVAQSATEAPVTQEATNAPKTQETANAAVTQAATTTPVTEAATNALVTEAATNALVTEAATNAPVTEAATDAPVTEAATDAPVNEAATNAPATEAAPLTQQATNASVTQQATVTEAATQTPVMQEANTTVSSTATASTQSSPTTTTQPLSTTMNPAVVADMKLNALDILEPSVTSALEARQKQLETKIQTLGEEVSRLQSEGHNIGGSAGEAMLKRAEELSIQEGNTVLAAEILVELNADIQEFFVDVRTQREEMAALLPTTTQQSGTSVAL